jgi:hypothetical protein
MVRSAKGIIGGLAALSLATGIGIAPAAHAARSAASICGTCRLSSFPLLWAQETSLSRINAQGSNFTPGGWVFVEVTDPGTGAYLFGEYTKAVGYGLCLPGRCPTPGTFTYTTTQAVPYCYQNSLGQYPTYLNVVAEDLTTRHFSNTQQVPAACIG